MSVVTLSTAFFGGILMFLAPCTLPLVPALLASLVPAKNPSQVQSRILVLRSLYFSLGFIIVFVLFGVIAGVFGHLFSAYKILLSQVGGVIVIYLGLSMLGIFTLPVVTRMNMPSFSLRKEHTHIPFILGVVFALGWTPCAGPLLASILIFGSTTTSVLTSVVLLIVFSLGLAIPFLLTGIFFSSSLGLIVKYASVYRVVQMISAAFLIVLGLILLFGEMLKVTHLGFLLYDFFGFVPMCTYF